MFWGFKGAVFIQLGFLSVLVNLSWLFMNMSLLAPWIEMFLIKSLLVYNFPLSDLNYWGITVPAETLCRRMFV